MAQKPDWYRLLKYWQYEKEPKGSVLSFSLLVGASRKPIGMPFDSDEDALSFSKSLYKEMTETIIDGYSAITQGCPGRLKGVGFYLERSCPDITNTPFEALWEFYREGITSGKFSLWFGNFYEFNFEKEESWIRQVLSVSG